MYASVLKFSARLGGAVVLAGLAGGCGTVESLMPGLTQSHNDNLATQRAEIGATAHAGPGAPSDKIVVLPASADDLQCPVVEVEDGAETVRFGGADNKSVRYQFDLVDTARECQPVGDKFSLKVGVSGRLLIGPAGTPGAYSTRMKILVRREVDQKTVFEKAYPVQANTAGAAQAPFQVVSELIMLPLTRAQLNDDYSIFVGFDNGRNVALERPSRHRKPKQKEAAAAR